MIIDAQVHAYAANSAEWPWAHPSAKLATPEVTGEQMVAAMDAAGVVGAILVSSWQVYRDNTRYAESVYRAHPDRFRLVAPIDTGGARVTQRVDEWIATPGAVGFRLFFIPGNDNVGHIPGNGDVCHPAVADTINGAASAGMAVNIHCWGWLSVMDELARAFPNAQLVLDHLGMTQPRKQPVPEDALADLDRVLALARYPNIAVKLTGACTYSRRPFPYDDLWEPIGRVIDTFGLDRCMWGTDWTRSTRILTYEEGISAFRDHWPMSDTDKATLLGGTAARIYKWTEPAGGKRA